MKKLDACNTIGIYVFEGVWTEKFTPFWWSPEVALSDMGFRTLTAMPMHRVWWNPLKRQA